MARTCRIDSVSVQGNGQVQVQYSSGLPPLPTSPSGNGLSYGSLQDLAMAIDAVEQSLTDEQLALMALAGWYKSDLEMSDPDGAAGRKITIDLTGGANSILVG